MTEQTRPQFSDALLERMLNERAGAGAPAGLVDTIATAVESTGQRAPGLLGAVSAPGAPRPRGVTRTVPSRRMIQMAALAIAVVFVAAGAGLFLRLSPALIGGPSIPPSIVPVPSPSVAPSSSPAPSPTTTPRPAAVVAFIRYVYRANPMAETGRVWIAGTDGSGAHELFTDGVGDQSGVAWSPDGTRLIFSEAGRFYLTDAGGSSPRSVDAGCVAPCSDTDAAFSPDGTQLVFKRATEGSWVIATMDLASGRVVELSSTAPDYGERPRWSPDSKRIVFSDFDKFDNKSAVFVVDADGQNLRRLSSTTLPARLPEWSPDGSRIVFTSYVTEIVRVAGTDVQKVSQDVYTVRPEWTDLRQLTTDGNSIGATWTPDGRILFARCAGGDCSATGLWTMDSDGGNVSRVVSGLGGDRPSGGVDAAWQPTP